MTELLFHQYDLSAVLQAHRQKLQEELNALPADYLLNVSEQDLQTFLLQKYRINAPLLRPEEATTPGARDTKIDVRGDFRYAAFDESEPLYINGTEVTVQIPYTGERQLFFCQPSSFNLNPPRATLTNEYVALTFRQTQQDPEQLKRDYENDLRALQEYLSWIRNDVRSHNDALPRLIVDSARVRKEKLLKDRNLEAAIGVPLKRTPAPPMAPVVKRKPPVKPAAPTTAFTPEPTIPDAEYDHILTIIENMVMVMERSPHAFTKMDQESLRDHILVQLNGHYEGQATGETFNFSGKTDILIRTNGKNAFVGECKFWSGERDFLATLDQLLGYTSFRDTKTAVIIFNKNQDHTSVLQKIKQVLPTHLRFKRDLGNRGESHFRTVFRHPTDQQREIYIAVLVFHIPAAAQQ